METIIVIFFAASFIGLILYVAYKSAKETNAKNERDINLRLNTMNDFIGNLLMTEHDKNYIINRLQSKKITLTEADDEIEKIVLANKRLQMLTEKYGKEIAIKLINHDYFIGMTEQQLIESKGSPSKIDTEILKTKTKSTYIYGNKSSGDYFIFENGLAIKIVDR